MEKSVVEETPSSKVTVKKEALNDDIKEFAETAMNELLGWYGYGSSNSRKGVSTRRSHSGSNSSGPESPKYNECCGWCGKTVDDNTALSSAAATFCSELCFSQSRRANFKKNKTCDWCRHVRHTVSYVDSQDGSTQLQFCSDKCLNQYKMHIFWREARAHLEVLPHLHGEESTSGNLITPDLWMTKCKSPQTQTSSPSHSPKLQENLQQTSPLPLITVAHPSKLMTNSHDNSDNKRSRNKVPKKIKKKSVTLSSTPPDKLLQLPEMPQDLRIRHSSPEVETVRNDQTSFHPEMIPPDPRFLHPHFFSNSEISSHRRFIDSLVPPPTLLVPYPIILPCPIPIPIPIPIPLKSGESKDASSQTDEVVESINETASAQLQNLDESVERNGKNSHRPLRKRRRVAEKRTKFVIKNKKVMSI